MDQQWASAPGAHLTRAPGLYPHEVSALQVEPGAQGVFQAGHARQHSVPCWLWARAAPTSCTDHWALLVPVPRSSRQRGSAWACCTVGVSLSGPLMPGVHHGAGGWANCSPSSRGAGMWAHGRERHGLAPAERWDRGAHSECPRRQGPALSPDPEGSGSD